MWPGSGSRDYNSQQKPSRQYINNHILVNNRFHLKFGISGHWVYPGVKNLTLIDTGVRTQVSQSFKIPVSYRFIADFNSPRSGDNILITLTFKKTPHVSSCTSLHFLIFALCPFPLFFVCAPYQIPLFLTPSLPYSLPVPCHLSFLPISHFLFLHLLLPLEIRGIKL